VSHQPKGPVTITPIGTITQVMLARREPASVGVVSESGTQQGHGRRVWALEGTGSYGAGLAAFLSAQGEWVVEIDRPKRSRGRSGAKSDPLDAIRAGREALAREQLATVGFR